MTHIAKSDRTRFNAFKTDVFITIFIHALVFMFVSSILFKHNIRLELSSIAHFLFFNSFLIPLILKDCYAYGSIGKTFYNLKVVNKNGETPSYYELILRNVMLLMPIIEIVFLITYKKRLGDMVLGTKVVEDKDHTKKNGYVKNMKFILLLLLTCISVQIGQTTIVHKMFNIRSYNNKESTKLELSLNQELTNIIDKSNVWILEDTKEVNITLTTKIHYFKKGNESFFKRDSEFIKKTISSKIDTTIYHITIELIKDMGTKKHIGYLYMNRRWQ